LILVKLQLIGKSQRKGIFAGPVHGKNVPLRTEAKAPFLDGPNLRRQGGPAGLFFQADHQIKSLQVERQESGEVEDQQTVDKGIVFEERRCFPVHDPGHMPPRIGPCQSGEQRSGPKHVADGRQLDDQDAFAHGVILLAPFTDPLELAGPIADKVPAVQSPN